MTIDEKLQKQVRAVNAIRWAGGGLGLIGAAGASYYDLSDAAFRVLLLGPIVTGLALSTWLGDRLKCPRCEGALKQELRGGILLFRAIVKTRVPSRRCPNCGADFTEHVPYNPIS